MEEATTTLDDPTCRTVVDEADLMVTGLEATVAAATSAGRTVVEVVCLAAEALPRQLTLKRYAFTKWCTSQSWVGRGHEAPKTKA